MVAAAKIGGVSGNGFGFAVPESAADARQDVFAGGFSC